VLIYNMPSLLYLPPNSVALEGFDIPFLVQHLAKPIGAER
jgi:hypothetical protein